MAVQVGTAFVDVRGDLSSLHKQLGSFFAGGKLGGMGKKAGLAVGAGLAGGLAAAGAGKALFSLGEQFDNAFDRVRVATGKTGVQLRGLQGDLKSVFKETPTDLDSVATAIGGIGSRLETSGKPLQRLAKQLLQLSNITGTDINENVESVTRLFKDWMVPTGQQTEQLNKLFRVGQKTGSTVANLSRLMVQFGSPLRQLGFDFETAAAMFGRFEKEGVNITTIMPGFRFALKNLAQPTGEAAEQLKKLGISAKDPKVALQDVFKAIKDAPTALKANAIAFAIFGRRAGPDMAAAVREGRFELDKLKGSMENSRDSIGRAETSTRDFGEEWQLLKNRLAVGLEPLARGVFSSISRMLKIVTDPNLSGAEKWDRISGIIGSALEKALEKVSEVAVRFGPKIAASLARGFVNAPPLIQLLTGAWLLKKAAPMLASAGLLGREAGAAFSAGMATTAASGAGAASVAGVAAGAAGRGKITRTPGIQRGGQLVHGPGFRSGEPISQLGRASKVLTPINAGLATMLTSLRAAPGLWGGLAAAVVIAGVKIKQSKTFEGLTGGLIDDKATKVQQAGLAALRSGLDELTAASRQAQDALPGIADAEANVSRLRKQGKTDTHEYAEAVRALDAAEEVRILGLRQQGEAQRKVAAGTKEDLRAALGRLGLDKKMGASAQKLRKDAIDVAQAYSRQAAAQLNVSRGMRGLAAITGPTGTKMGALLKTLQGVAGFPAFKKFLITADISQASAAVRLVERLRTLGREKTALKIIAESKSPEQALRRLRGLVDDVAKREHRIVMRLKDEATLRLERLKRAIDRLPEKKKLTFDADVHLTRRLADLMQRAGLGPAAKQLRLRARGGITRPEELTVVGEEGAELAKLPTGKMTMLGREGPELRELPVGTRVYSHPETKRKLAPLTQEIVQRLVPASTRKPRPLVQSIVQKLGIPGFAKGGTVRKKKPGKSEALGFAREIWPRAAPHLHAQGMPMPKVEFSRSSAMKTGSSGPGTVWVTQGKSGLDKIVGAPWFMRALANRTYQGLHTLVHEFGHIFQLDPRNLAQQEGGAEAFARRASPSVANELGVEITPTYEPYDQQITALRRRRGKGYKQFVLNRQFGYRSTGTKTRALEKVQKEMAGQLWYETGDSDDPGRRIARTSQLAGVSVTPNEVTQITNKWGVNRAVASIGAAVKDKFPAMNIISGYFGRENSRTPNRSVSNHAKRAALDLGSKGSLNTRIGSWVRANFPPGLRGTSEGVLDLTHDPNPPDHDDHVHVAAFGSEALAKVMEAGGDGSGVGKAPRRFRKLSLGQYITVAKKVGFPDPALAAAIFYPESKFGNVGAEYKTDREWSLGGAQINVLAHTRLNNERDRERLREDIFFNFREALKISKGGKDFTPWTMYTNKRYKDFLGGKAKPLPRGTSKGDAGGSTFTDYLENRRLLAKDTLSDKDDIRWINRSLRYWRGVLRRNKRAGNFKRQNEALQNIQELKADRLALKEEREEPELYTLGELSTIGTGPNAFNIGGMGRVLDQIDLEGAQASLTIPRDDDETQAGIAASLQDDIAAASKLVSIRDSIYKLTQGFRMPARQLSGPFDPSPAQTKALNRTKSPQERITLLQRYIAEATQGPWIEGTIKQKTEAANDLSTAREALKGHTDEAGRKEETPETASDAPDRSGDASSFLASISDLLKQHGSNILNLKFKLPAFAKGGLAHGWSIVGEEGPELAHFSKPTEIISNPVSKKIAKSMGVPGFAQGTPIQPSHRDPATAQPLDMEKFVKQLVKAIEENKSEVVKNIDARSYFKEVPAEPHQYSKAVAFQMEAAV